MPAKALKPESRVREFVIRRILGQGSYGITYLAKDTSRGRPVAMKEYFPQDFATRAPDGTTVDRKQDNTSSLEDFDTGLDKFLDEAKTLAGFKDDHIVKVFDYFEHNGTAYVVMQYEEGGTMERYLQVNRRPIPEQELLDIFIPLLQGLRAVHASWFLHRDIKPENIYLRKSGDPLLIDFGTARHATSARQSGMTEYLTRGYAPPEQYDRNAAHGPWTDIYALGATMYQCVTRLVPDEGCARTGKEDPVMPAVEAAPAFYRRDLLEVIDWMMRPLYSERPQNVDEVLERLVPMRDGVGSGSRVGDAAAAAASVAGAGAPTVESGGGGPPSQQRPERTRQRLEPDPVQATVARGGNGVAAQAETAATEPIRLDFDAGPPPYDAPESGITLTHLSREKMLVWGAAGVCLLLALVVILWLTGRSEEAAPMAPPVDTTARLQPSVPAPSPPPTLQSDQSPSAASLAAQPPPTIAAPEPPRRETVSKTPVVQPKIEPPSAAERALVGDLVLVPKGCFEMGESRSRHRVCINRSFYLGKYEVTFEQYDRFVKQTNRRRPRDRGWGRGQRPVIEVSWRDAQAFAAWVSEQTGRRYRLPTEAEWEYACRSGGKDESYCGGGDPASVGWYSSNSGGKTQPVGGKKPNRLGLHDMSGNVWEWTCSGYDARYKGGEKVCTKRRGAERVMRGGSWGSQSSSVRATKRLRNSPNNRFNNIGFRLAREIE